MDLDAIEVESNNLNGGVGRIEEVDGGGDRKENGTGKERIAEAIEETAAARIVYRE